MVIKNRIVVLTHKSPDYDAICSSSSLAKYLEKLSSDNDVYLVLESNKLVQNLHGDIKYYSIDDVKNIDFDSVYVCDVNEVDRTYGVQLIDKISKDKRFLIDHHDKNREELDIPLENRIIEPAYSSTCEIIAEKLDINKLERDVLKNLYMGIISDTAGLTRNVSKNTHLIINNLGLDTIDKNKIYDKVCALSEEQLIIYKQIGTLDLNIENCMIYTLFSDTDITPLIKHPKFDELTKPTEDNPVSIFIIGVQNNYFIKFKKLIECDIDILSMAISCNGGGHENRCAGRFCNSSLDEVINILKSFLDNKKIEKVKKYGYSNK